MKCEHTRIQSVNCVISCADCGEILPIDYLVAKDRIKAQNAEEKAVEDTPKKSTGRKKVK